MRNIPDNNLAYPVLLLVDNIARGSGFRLIVNDKTFLVTAKHVLFDDGILKGKTIEIHCPTQDLGDDSTYVFTLDLAKVTPLAHKNSDVCIIHMANNQETKGDQKKLGDYIIKALDGVECTQKGNSIPVLVNAEYGIKRLKDVLISNDTFLYGYPISLGLNHGKDFDFTKPLLRKGIVSNINIKNGTIILDCWTDYGNSGGPVIEVEIIDGNAHHNVIGIVSKFLTLKNEWVNTRDKARRVENINTGYTVVVSMDRVFEVIDDYISK